MTPEERKRAGQAVANRIRDLQTSAAAIARAAQVDPKTVRALINGTHWPTYETRARITRALRWPAGEIPRRAIHATDIFAGVPSSVMLAELSRRAEVDESSTAGEQ